MKNLLALAAILVAFTAQAERVYVINSQISVDWMGDTYVSPGTHLDDILSATVVLAPHYSDEVTTSFDWDPDGTLGSASNGNCSADKDSGVEVTDRFVDDLEPLIQSSTDGFDWFVIISGANEAAAQCEGSAHYTSSFTDMQYYAPGDSGSPVVNYIDPTDYKANWDEFIREVVAQQDTAGGPVPKFLIVQEPLATSATDKQMRAYRAIAEDLVGELRENDIEAWTVDATETVFLPDTSGSRQWCNAGFAAGAGISSGCLLSSTWPDTGADSASYLVARQIAYYIEPFDAGDTGVWCSSDDDSDGVCDNFDNCTHVANADQFDFDSDGIGTLCDFDVNEDLVVGTPDYGLVFNEFGESGPPWNPLKPWYIGAYDVNDDGAIGTPDVGAVFNAFSKNPVLNSELKCGHRTDARRKCPAVPLP